jgi:hypothetical protein
LRGLEGEVPVLIRGKVFLSVHDPKGGNVEVFRSFIRVFFDV